MPMPPPVWQDGHGGPAAQGGRSVPAWTCLVVVSSFCLLGGMAAFGAYLWTVRRARDGAEALRRSAARAVEEARAGERQRAETAEALVARERERRATAESRLAELAAQLQREEAVHMPVWEPVFHDDFERAELGAHWRPQHGGWAVQDGKLVSTSLATENFIVCEGVDFSGDVQVVFAGRTLESYNGDACDMSLALGLAARGPVGVNDGYLFRFGSFDNTWSGLSGPAGIVVRNRKVRIEAGKLHRVVIQRYRKRFTMTVDGEPVFLVYDGTALDHPELRRAAFYIYRSRVAIESFLVLRPRRVAERVEKRYRRRIEGPAAPADPGPVDPEVF